MVTKLTPCELEIINVMMHGLSYKGMAFRLGISYHAVKRRLATLYDKLDCSNQVQLVVKAMQLGLIPLPVVESKSIDHIECRDYVYLADQG